MNILGIIEKKRDNKELSEKEIVFFIDNFVNKNIKDYQASSLLMAIYLNGMTFNETFYLTKAIVNSGEIIDFKDKSNIYVDKHSTGGVGDNTTLLLMPLLASLGFKVGKMSGRGLSYTGGTIDKLESISGFNVQLSNQEFKQQIDNIGIALISQNEKLCIADKLLYHLRDVTGTVESIPLIASSIMSKKIASGADVIILDVKVGNGAFMKNIEDAILLTDVMVKLGKQFGKKIIAFLTDMSSPLGYNIGNSLEVIEVIEILKNQKDNELLDFTKEIAIQVLVLNGDSFDSANLKVNESLKENTLNNLKKIVKSQNGNPLFIDNIDLFTKSKFKYELVSPIKGYIEKLDALKLGIIARDLGAGRINKDSVIDYSAGIVLNKKIGSEIKEKEVILTLYSNSIIQNSIIDSIHDAVKIGDNKINKQLILKVIK